MTQTSTFATLSAIAQKAAVAAAQAEQNPFGWLSFRALMLDEMTPPRWVVQSLEIGPGRPCGLWGYGGTGKSYIAMALALSVASGEPFMGKVDVRRGVVAHLSHELGTYALKDRYRRLANGAQLATDQIEGRLRVAAYPKIYLNSKAAEEWYSKEFDGVDLVIIDSLRRALPGEDENDSTISNYLDTLSRVSDRLGITFLLLHHARKDQAGGKSDKREVGRGSSAIFDGSGCVWLVEGTGRGPRECHQIRAHDDGDGGIESFHCDLVSVAQDDATFHATRGALRLEWLDEGEIDRRQRASERRHAREQFERDETRIVEAVTEAGSNATMRRILTLTGDSRRVRANIAQLVESGRLSVTTGNKGATYYSVNEKDPFADWESDEDWVP